MSVPFPDSYYPHSTQAIEAAVRGIAERLKWEVFSQEQPDARWQKERLCNLLFMVEKVRSFDRHGEGALERATKSARWIGWMLREIELISHEIGGSEWGNTRSRDVTREDVHAGFDRPTTI